MHLHPVATYRYKTLQLHIHADIVTVTLYRPDKKNAMSIEMMNELLQVAEHLRKDRTLRAVILTGTKDSFCSGIDLGDLNQPKRQAWIAWQLIKPTRSLFQAVCLVWRELPMPVLAALSGHCLGAGLQLALACDVRFAHPEAKFAIMEGKWGLVADMGLSRTAIGTVRLDALKALAMSADICDAHAALDCGLITYISADPLDAANDLAAAIANRSPDAVQASKVLMNGMYPASGVTLYREKLWQLKLLLGRNRPRAQKKVKDSSVSFAPRQW
ncbi:crotonase/enoyl-CoA hydratase family protein [Psychrobacter aestuarii]|uniref:Crotonase/enoyl-CoA hydratase family protein n=1 Tax=Psychrobacter aestuarii TaxID=556327 RepID=A0ABN0VL02_9GAMM|nr:crotonase/enoyl-CoA hydratase family protein [Psychrobacter aestuarii]